MVGVPGRSKACNTCKKRRIACGQERPQCAQCIKSNRICGGYQRERIWIPSNTKVEDTIKTLAQKSSDETVKYSKPPTTSGRRKKTSATASSSTSTTPPDYLSTALTATPTATISAAPAYRHQILSDFISCYIPSGPSNASGIRPSDTAGTWIVLLADLPSWTQALETSLLAVCIAKIGRLHGNDVLIKEGMKMYGRGLWEVQKALWDPKLMYKDETLAACLALTMYETIECPEANGIGWLTHTGGCARLVQLRGPAAHQGALSHALFRAIRWTTVLQCLTLQRPSFLSEPDWLTIPWAHTSKPLMDRLMDCYAVGVSINAEAYFLSKQDPSTLYHQSLAIVKKCWDLDAQLQPIFDELKATTLGPLYWPEFSKMPNAADDPVLGKVFPVALWFPDMHVAVLCVLYWTFLVILYSGLTAMYMVIETLPRPPVEMPVEVEGEESERGDTPGAVGGASSTSSESPPSVSDSNTTTSSSQAPSSSSSASQTSLPPLYPHGLPPLNHRSDIPAACRPICESVEYFLQDSMRALGPSTIAFPVQVVIANLAIRPECARETGWCYATLGAIVQRGFRILEVKDIGGVRVKDLEGKLEGGGL